MKGEVKHSGIITEITAEKTIVEIVSQSACAACHAKGLCGASEEATKHITVRTEQGSDWKVGDQVEVTLRRSLGLKAVAISYIIPLLILLILVVSLPVVLESEYLVGLCAIAGIAVYYFIVYLLRDRLADGYEFHINK